jgi:hypothetical protein
VYFTNGKAITVKTVEKGPKLTILEIEGGGRIGIPTVQIDRIEDLNLSPPAAPAAVPQTQVTAIIPVQPTAAPLQAAPQPQSAIPAGPGTGGNVALNSALKMTPPLSVGGDAVEDSSPRMPAPGPATQSTPPGSMNRMNRPGGMMGGPGAMQRGRRGYNPYNHGLPSGLQGNPGATPPGSAPANGAAPGQANAAGQPNAAQPPAGSGQPAAGSQAAQTGQPAQPPPPPPAATTPPPPPPDPEPSNEPDPGSNSDSSDDGSSSPDSGSSSSGGDSGN